MSHQDSLVRLWELHRPNTLPVMLTPARPDDHRGAIHLNPGGPARDNEDPLFSYVPPLPGPKAEIYIAFKNLSSKFEPRRGTPEAEDDPAREEFFQLLLSCDSMEFAFNELHAKGHVESKDQFVEGSRVAWFGLYNRGDRDALESCGFEHTFLGDLTESGRKLSGFHNWYQFYLKELDRNVDFLNFRGTCQVDGVPRDETPEMLHVNLEYVGGTKKYGSSMLIGTSPDFEIALYTMVYFMGGLHQKQGTTSEVVRLGEYDCKVKVRSDEQGHITSAFPKITAWREGRQ